MLETRFYVFIAQDENRSASSLKEFSPPVAVLFPSQFSSDVGVEKFITRERFAALLTLRRREP